MIDLQHLSREKQLIQLRMSVSLDVQRTLEHTLGITPDAHLTVGEVLERLQSHFKNQQNEALRRRELLCCKKTASEPFSECYVRLKNLAEEIDLCSGDQRRQIGRANSMPHLSERRGTSPGRGHLLPLI